MTELAETSNWAPALIGFQGKLFLAWTIRDNKAQLNLMSSSDGVTFSNKVTLNESSSAGPALAVFGDKLYIAWTGTDAKRSLNLMSSTDGVTFGNKVMLNESSIANPSIASLKDKLYIVWSEAEGADKGFLQLMSSTDGVSFVNEVNLNETSAAGPALLGVDASDQDMLVLAWTGENGSGHLNVATIFPGSGIAISNKQTLSDTTYPNIGPALQRSINGFVLGYVGQGNHNIFLLSSLGTPGSFIFNKEQLTATSIAQPAFYVWTNQNLLMAWSGTNAGHTLNITSIGKVG